MPSDNIAFIANQLNLATNHVRAVVQMLDEGATVPFISRYRKEKTGSMDETRIRAIETELARLRQLDSRRQTIIDSIKEQDKLTPELLRAIEEAPTSAVLEDLYLPYRPKRRTRATVARERGLEPLARMIMGAHGICGKLSDTAARFTGVEVPDANSAIAGASDIIAEWVSESSRARNAVRRAMSRDGVVKSSVVKGKEAEGAKYANYFNFSRPVRQLASHQYLAICRAADEGFLRVNIDTDDDAITDELIRRTVPRDTTAECRQVIEAAVTDGYRRLLRPSIENEVSASIKEKADQTAIALFSDNLRQLLLAAPLRGKRVLAIDPGFRTGCKVVAIDAEGNLLADTVIFPNQPHEDIGGAELSLRRLINDYRLNAIALGDRTASRETEAFLRSSGLADEAELFIVSENGASVYSASDIAREEFPNHDVTVRGAVSIGRRLIDPLAELVKIDPKSIGVGQYQHDVNQNALREALDFTVMSCVNAVGVNINTASARLLSYISGIGPSLATKIVEYRRANGPFPDRKALMKVPRLGAKAFEQAAGFLRVPDSDNPLDNTGIHPESYAVARRMAVDLGVDVGELAGNRELINRIDPAMYAYAGVETVADIIAELRKPGRDPRLEATNVDFDPAIANITDLYADMILPGKVSNITAFGAFVDIGIKENGLLHISQLGRRVTSPAEVLKINQIIKVRVLAVDLERKRISLTLNGVK